MVLTVSSEVFVRAAESVCTVRADNVGHARIGFQ